MFAPRIIFHIIRVHKVGASPGGREAPTFLHIIRLLGESLSHNFSIVLVCENFALAENHFSFNSAEDHFPPPSPLTPHKKTF